MPHTEKGSSVFLGWDYRKILSSQNTGIAVRIKTASISSITNKNLLLHSHKVMPAQACEHLLNIMLYKFYLKIKFMFS